MSATPYFILFNGASGITRCACTIRKALWSAGGDGTQHTGRLSECLYPLNERSGRVAHGTDTTNGTVFVAGALDSIKLDLTIDWFTGDAGQSPWGPAPNASINSGFRWESQPSYTRRTRSTPNYQVRGSSTPAYRKVI